MSIKLLTSLLVTLFALSTSPIVFSDSHRGVSDDHISDTGRDHRSDGNHDGQDQDKDKDKDKDKKDKTKDKKVKKEKRK